MSFAELNLIDPLLRAVAQEGYAVPMPIQRQAIPHLLAGRDLIGCAQTGTGKTAAFALPILQHLSQHPSHPGQGHHRPVRVLVLSPTRELAAQIGDSFAAYGRFTHTRHSVIFGGVGQEPQVRALRAGVDVLVATPGRLLDLLDQKLLSLASIEVFVLDEADRMLDMGFIHDVRKVISALPRKRQTLLFSATMPDEIRELSRTILRDPVSVAVTPVSSTAEKIDQSVHHIGNGDKRALLITLLRDPTITRALVFTRTKHGANRVAEFLDKRGVEAMAIHGNKSQSARERALEGFRRGEVRVLVATDIAARGLDVEGISHVFNFDLPEVPEQYVHRIGRTARAGASGRAVSFCSPEERPLLADIEKLIRAKVPVAAAVKMEQVPAQEPRAAQPRQQQQQQQQRGGGRQAQSERGGDRADPSDRGRRRRGRGGRGGGPSSGGRSASTGPSGSSASTPRPSSGPTDRPATPPNLVTPPPRTRGPRWM